MYRWNLGSLISVVVAGRHPRPIRSGGSARRAYRRLAYCGYPERRAYPERGARGGQGSG